MQNLSNKTSPEDRCIIPQESSMISYLDFLLSINTSENMLKSLTHELNSARKGNDFHGIAKIQLAMGRYYLLTHNCEKSIDYCAQSIDGFRQSKDINGLIAATIGLSQAYNFLSNFVQVGRLNMQLNEMLFQTGDPIAKAYIRLNMAEHAILNMAEHSIVIGKIAYMETDIKTICDISKRERCWLLFCIANIVLGYLSLERKDSNSAVFYLNSAVKLIERYNMPVIFTGYTYYLLPEAYWLDYKLHADKWTPSRKKAATDNIKHLCESALSKTKSCLLHHGGALRIKAKYLLLENRMEEAESLFLQSIAYCSKFGRKFELGLSYYFYAFLLNSAGRPAEARINLQSARKHFRQVGAAIYLKRISDILKLSAKHGGINCGEAAYDQNRTLTTIINISRNLSIIKEIDELTIQILHHALTLSGADNGCIFIRNEKRELELKAAKGFSTAAAIRKIAAKRSTTTPYRPFELYIPIKIGSQEVGLCYLTKQKSFQAFNGHDTGSIYLFLSQVAAFMENCRLTEILNRQKKATYCTITLSTEKKLRKAVKYIENNYSAAISRSKLAKRLDINADNLGRFFKLYTGCKINEFTNRLRMEEAARRLKETDEKIVDIAFSVGFESLTTFNRVFSSILKTTPTKYRKQHQRRFNERFSA